MSATHETDSSQSSGTLLHLLADISRDPELVERFTTDPQAVFQEYGIPSDKLALLRSRDTKGILDVITREATALLEDVKEPPIQRNPWPIHGIQVKSCTPNSGPVKATLELTVKGSLFAKNATLSFQTPTITVQATHVKVRTDRNGNSVLTANAVFEQASTYDVVVTNSPGNSGTLPSGFTAKAS
ncbi:hypothetical protein [Pendulispora albinea]|uniref:Uncharacterized protein n=1 Tax=Pendulispora albinea TaxID=2741071 RepID=A0ABZ2LT31_9BACT